MDKHDLLRQLSVLAEQHLVSEQEVLQALRQGKSSPSQHGTASRFTEILYYIGGLIIFIGITVLIVQNWEMLNSITRILVTLGVGIAAYVMGVLYMQRKITQNLTTAFFFLSTILLPTGLFITFHEAGFDVETAGTNVVISGILLGTYLASYSLYKRNFFLLFTIIYATWLFFAFTSLLFGGNPILVEWKFYAYRVMITGLSFIFIGYSFRDHERRKMLTGPLYAFGILGFLASTLALGGWRPEQSLVWELLFPGIDLAVIFLGVVFKTRAFLVFGAMFLMAYILKITSEYFSSGFGWPLSLVLLGLVFIAIGYFTYHLNRKYLG
ncbi:TPA: hypothetical protein DCL30_03675 [Candidatus Peribacteria bacterium]|nr:MAG: hypothetical protein A2529_00835 [Candidatus Peribacteria bacterium RIFOXYD2_FULL_58_15]HAI98606.1 hypothetical protein [Candidatus Peribacteria bacterium]HAS34319.1 hypothetical protein [Candidatus Peribacteria bacterium]